MDKLTEKETTTQSEDTPGKNTLFSKVGTAFTAAKESRQKNSRALLFDLGLIVCALLFARCHVVFGSHPLGVALVAALPLGVWQALLGAAIGSLTLGRDGIIYALISSIVAFLRVVISGADKKNADGSLFGENLLLRMSAATIGGFISAVYEILLSGMTRTGILFGIAMILLPPAMTFVFSGLFSTGVGFRDLVFGKGNIFSFNGKTTKEKYNIVFFQISSLVFLFFLTLSLGEFDLLGISAAYIFVSLVTLIVAKRFGALRALATGFATSLGISGVYAVSFALEGLGAGILFGFGTGYALLGGGAALSAWSIYSSGLTGFLTTLPEYAIAAVISIPILKNVSAERTEKESDEVSKSAQDMVGTMALSYRHKYSKGLDALEIAFSSLSGVIKNAAPAKLSLSKDEYRGLAESIADSYCMSCESRELCSKEKISPCKKSAAEIADKLSRGERISSEDVNTDTEFCCQAKKIAEAINRTAAKAECENYRIKKSDTASDEYALIAKLINETRTSDEAERALDGPLSEALGGVIGKCGFADGVIRVFGERRKHIIMAGEDESGEKITSAALARGIESATGLKLGAPEFFKKGNMALMECDIRRAFRIECASASMPGDEREICGDTARIFEASSDYFYALIADGMGKGELAKQTSNFTASFLERILGFAASKETVLHMLNHALRRRSEECSVTVDLFEFDLLTGDATFIKSGAAPSYVKRDSSLFRIRSQTAPIGLMRNIDTEKVRVEVKPEDYVIMLSDGICAGGEEAPWLLELLAGPPKKTPKEYADLILSEARKNAAGHDDMSVVVLKILAA